MRNPELKTLDGNRFGTLILPSTDVNSDEELYVAVREYGKAIIAPYRKDSYEREATIKLTPEEFEKEWRGD